MHSLVPAPLPVALQETRTAQLLLSQFPRSPAAPRGQNPSQNGLAGVKICGLRRSTFMGRNTAGVTPPRLAHLESARYSPSTIPGGHAMQTPTQTTTTTGSGLKVKTHVKAGDALSGANHSQTLVRPTG